VKLLRLVFKRVFQALALVLAFPAAALTLFGRIKPVYTFFAQSFALGPGLPGGYLRAAYYKMTLHESSLDVTLSFGTYFVQPDCMVEKGVSIGAYCVIGRSSSGARCQIASHVLMPSGRRQHVRNADGTLSDCTTDRTSIGPDCWIGDGAIVNVADQLTVKANAVIPSQLTLDDLFDAPALAQIERDCRAQIVDEFGPDAITDDGELSVLLHRIESWTIAPREVTIRFPRYAIMSGVSPGGECTFTADALRPLLRSGNPLW